MNKTNGRDMTLQKSSTALILSFLVAIIFCTQLSAANQVNDEITLKLTSGKIVEGTVTERRDDYIKIDSGIGIETTYYLDEIESINGADVKSSQEEMRAPQLPSENRLKEKELVNLALQEVAAQNFQQAALYYEQLVEMNPTKADYHYHLGLNYRFIEKKVESVDALNKALSLGFEETSEYPVMIHLFALYMDLEKLEEVLIIAPKLIQFLEEQGDYEKAEILQKGINEIKAGMQLN